jgi:hypothetical protein
VASAKPGSGNAACTQVANGPNGSEPGGSYADGFLFGPALAVVSALTLLAGFWIRRRTRRGSAA